MIRLSALGLLLAVSAMAVPVPRVSAASCTVASDCSGANMVCENGACTADGKNLIRRRTGIYLLEPLFNQGNPEIPDATNVQAQQGIDIIYKYFRASWPYISGVATGIGVLQALIGGIEIMLSGGDSGRRQSGITRLLWSIGGLMLILLTGFILRVLNPLFYR